MTNLFLVPAGNPTARRNFEQTVRRRVPRKDLSSLSPTALKAAKSAVGGVSAWGTKAGKRDINVSTWRAMAPGDRVLFYFDGLFPFSGRVVTREHSPAVAKRLWGSEGGQTWEYVYLLDHVRQVDIPRLALNERLDYEPDSYPRGFARVNRELESGEDTVEQLLEELSGAGHQIRLAIEAARAGEEMEAATALDRLSSELSEEQLRREVAAFTSSERPKSQRRLIEILERDRKLVAKLKKLYEGRCQYCGFTFLQNNGRPYCEAAHLEPMARREADIDVKDNLFVLCPNHHKMLDHGPLRIEFDPVKRKLFGVINGRRKPMTNKHVGI